jgi:galactitol-specific phosphotransferase system IIC component
VPLVFSGTSAQSFGSVHLLKRKGHAAKTKKCLGAQGHKTINGVILGRVLGISNVADDS